MPVEEAIASSKVDRGRFNQENNQLLVCEFAYQVLKETSLWGEIQYR